MDVKIYGYKIREERKNLRYTQREFGKLIGCSQTMVDFIEKDERVPSSIVLGRIAKLSKKSVNYFYKE